MYQQNQQGLYSDEHYLPNHGSPTRLFHNRFLPSFGPTEQKGKRRDLKIHSHPATHKSAGGGEASSKAMFHYKCNCTKPKNKASSFELLRYWFVSIASSSLLPPATIPSASTTRNYGRSIPFVIVFPWVGPTLCDRFASSFFIFTSNPLHPTPYNQQSQCETIISTLSSFNPW